MSPGVRPRPNSRHSKLGNYLLCNGQLVSNQGNNETEQTARQRASCSVGELSRTSSVRQLGKASGRFDRQQEEATKYEQYTEELIGCRALAKNRDPSKQRNDAPAGSDGGRKPR